MPQPKRPARKRQLTELAIRKLKPARAAYLIWDLKQRGLAIRVQPSGGKAWKVIYSRLGRPRWLHLGDANAIGLADARTLAAEAMLAVAKGTDPAAEKRAKRGTGTFAELAADYVEQHAKRKNKSWRQSEYLVERYLSPRWGKLQAGSITRSDVKAVMARIEAPVLANQILAAASAIFSWAVKEEKLPTNPCIGVARNATRSRDRVLADSEVPKFWTAFDDAGLVTSTALKLVLLTGQRPGEVAHMRREHVRDGGWWEMPGQPVPALGWPGTKNGASHRIWLSKPVQALIEELTDGTTTGFVFPTTRGRQGIWSLDAAMRTICKRLDIERVTPHDLRRSFLTAVTQLGFGRDLMDRIANHKESKKKVTDVYDRHQYGPEIQRAMEAVAARIMALAEGRPDEKVVPLRR